MEVIIMKCYTRQQCPGLKKWIIVYVHSIFTRGSRNVISFLWVPCSSHSTRARSFSLSFTNWTVVLKVPSHLSPLINISALDLCQQYLPQTDLTHTSDCSQGCRHGVWFSLPHHLTCSIKQKVRGFHKKRGKGSSSSMIPRYVTARG